MQRWEVRDQLSGNGWFEYNTAKAAWKAAYRVFRANERVFGPDASVTVTCIYSEQPVQRLSYTLTTRL